jgi:hypothetical protein
MLKSAVTARLALSLLLLKLCTSGLCAWLADSSLQGASGCSHLIHGLYVLGFVSGCHGKHHVLYLWGKHVYTRSSLPSVNGKRCPKVCTSCKVVVSATYVKCGTLPM